MTKQHTCSKCGEPKSVAEFSKDRRSTDGLCGGCKDCAKAANAAWYAANPEKKRAASAAWYAANREKVNAATAVRRAANPEKFKARDAARCASSRRFINSIKTTTGCVDCGYNDLSSKLDFDHVRGEKSFTIGGNVSHSLPVLVAEVEKCEVRCRPCHAARHAASRLVLT